NPSTHQRPHSRHWQPVRWRLRDSATARTRPLPPLLQRPVLNGLGIAPGQLPCPGAIPCLGGIDLRRTMPRSEERRVGKEGRTRRWPEQEKKKNWVEVLGDVDKKIKMSCKRDQCN